MYALFVYQSGGECVYFVGLPEWGLNVYALLVYQNGIECVCFVGLPEWR